MKSGVRFRRPTIELKFISERSKYKIVHDTRQPENLFSTESIITFNSINSMSDDCSAFSVTLVGYMEWDKIITDNDLMILYIYPNQWDTGRVGQDFDLSPQDALVGVGFVSEIRKEGNFEEDRIQYRITGQSFQKSFMQFELKTIQQVQLTIPNQGWMDADLPTIDSEPLGTTEDGTELVEGIRYGGFTGELAGKTIAEVTKIMLDRFTKYMKYTFRDEEDNGYLKRLDYSHLNSWEDYEHLVNPIPFTSFEGSFNQLLLDISTKPFCETFFVPFVGRDGIEKSRFVLRRTPFDKEDWEKLSTYKITSDDVIQEVVAKSDLDAYSLYNVMPEDLSNDYALVYARPVFNKHLVDKFGYRMLEVKHRFLGFMDLREREGLELDFGSSGGGSGGGTRGSGDGESFFTFPAGLGTFKSYMDYRTITNRSSKQYKLQHDGNAVTGAYGLRFYRGNHMVAVATKFATVGDLITVKLSNGKSFNAIVGDVKADNHVNDMGVHTGDANFAADGSIVEFIVDRHRLSPLISNSGNVGAIPEYSGSVMSIKNNTRAQKGGGASSDKIEKFVNYAVAQQGSSYSQDPVGRMSPGVFDCSSLVLRAMRAAGLDSTNANLTTRTIANDPRFTPINIGSIKRGDVVWSPGHVAIYLGGGKIMEAVDYGVPARISNMRSAFTKAYRIKGA